MSKKSQTKPWLVDEWCIPKAGGEFVWRMEDVRVPGTAALAAAVAAREHDRNQRDAGANWRFTAADARVRLKRLYLVVN